MCGIVGTVGGTDLIGRLMDGLARLEYRGYDSAGVAYTDHGGIKVVKAAGRLCELEKRVDYSAQALAGIGHTRWATHGAPNDRNSHPHCSKSGMFAVVHNGIIENCDEIKEFLLERGFSFRSETDSEAVAHLLDYYYRGDVAEAMVKTALRIKGSYALAVLCAELPHLLFAMRKDSPLVIGLCKGFNCAASDMSALIELTQDFILPDEGEIAVLSESEVRVINFNREETVKRPVKADWQKGSAEKNGYAHFMLKEIYEQPRAVRDTINSVLPRLPLLKTLKNVKRIYFIGCGSAHNACRAAKYFIERRAGIPTECYTAGEFRYYPPIFEEGALTIAVSQSGETADTIAAALRAKKNSNVLSIINVAGSTLARISDEVIYTPAGPEIAVATTKGYLCQVTALWLIGLFLSGGENLESLAALKNLPDAVCDALKDTTPIQQLSSRFSGAQSMFFIGRGGDYAVAAEGALKLKEISYIHAQSYPAGELKHGTISLIENGTPVIAVATDARLADKTLSSIREVQSRGALAVAVTCFEEIASAADYSIMLKKEETAPFFAAVSLQLFAYYTALSRGCDIDKPRNLAKSVTVE